MNTDAPDPSNPSRLRILSFNVNGLFAILKRLYNSSSTPISRLLNDLNADIVCLQETKLRRSELVAAAHQLATCAEGWDSFFSCCTSPSRAYSGTATFVKTSKCLPFYAESSFTTAPTALSVGQATTEPLYNAEIHPDLASLVHPQPQNNITITREDLQQLDSEGRVTITDHGSFVLFNIYGPAITGEDEERVESRIEFKRKFYTVLQKRWEAILREGRAVVVVGDFNITPTQLDCPNCRESDDVFYDESTHFSRAWLRNLLVNSNTNFTDCFRAWYPERKNAFTVWSVATGSRALNYGARIDLTLTAGLDVVVSTGGGAENNGGGGGSTPTTTRIAVVGADIEPEVLGSDHCPVWVELGLIPSPSFTPPPNAPSSAQSTMLSTFPCSKIAPPLAMRYQTTGKQSKLHDWLMQDAKSDEEAKAQEQEKGNVLTTAREGEGVHTDDTDTHWATTTTTNNTREEKMKKKKQQKSLTTFLKKKGFGVADDDEKEEGATDTEKQEVLNTATTTTTKGKEEERKSTVCVQAELEAAALLGLHKRSIAKSEWASFLQHTQEVPRCHHQEAAAKKKVNKSGPNQGRYFWMCARPKGQGPEAQCTFFKWVQARTGDAPRTTMNSTVRSKYDAATKKPRMQ